MLVQLFNPIIPIDISLHDISYQLIINKEMVWIQTLTLKKVLLNKIVRIN